MIKYKTNHSYFNITANGIIVLHDDMDFIPYGSATILNSQFKLLKNLYYSCELNLSMIINTNQYGTISDDLLNYNYVLGDQPFFGYLYKVPKNNLIMLNHLSYPILSYIAIKTNIIKDCMQLIITLLLDLIRLDYDSYKDVSI